VEKSRIRNLSTRYLEAYRYGFIVLLSGAFCWVVVLKINEFSSGGNWVDLLYFPVFWGYLVYLWLKAHLKVYRVEFDAKYLYVLRKNQDVLIPLENIKDIEMKSLGGMWRVDLYYTDVLGDHFYFKPSLLYPLNYRRKDALVSLLWQHIEKAKQRRPITQHNALHS
jgi:hypothetical protein